MYKIIYILWKCACWIYTILCNFFKICTLNVQNCVHFFKNGYLEYRELCTFFETMCTFNVQNSIYCLKNRFLNVQNCVHSLKNCTSWIYRNMHNFFKKKCILNYRIVYIIRKIIYIECIELCTLNILNFTYSLKNVYAKCT